MRATLLLVALLLAGCAAPAPQGRTVPVGGPDARELLLSPEDLPPGFDVMGRTRGNDPGPWPGIVDQDGVQMARVREGAAMADHVGCNVWSFGTPDEARAMVANVSREFGNVTARPWGDEAYEGSFGEMRDRRDAALLLRNGTLVWVISITEHTPYANDLALADLAARVLAKADARA